MTYRHIVTGTFKWGILMSIKKIIAFTGIRSDYDLMSNLYKKMYAEEEFDLKLIVCGSHLSERQGYTVGEIEKDGVPILARIENLIDSNKLTGRLKSLSILMQNSIHTIVDYNPDLIIVAGDREEVIVGSIIGTYLNIPIAHFFAGDHDRSGHVDNSIRHATTKLSSFHFVSNPISGERLLKMGEESRRVFNIGSPSLDKFNTTPLISKEELLEKFNLSKIYSYAVLIFHPNFGEEDQTEAYFRKILEVLKDRKIFTFVSYPNVDSGFMSIIKVIEEYKNDSNFYFYKNLPREEFINLFRHMEFLIGNSSSGLYEAPLLKKPVINVGKRQLGRYSADNVVFVGNEKHQINKALEEISTTDFMKGLENTISIYGDGYSTDKAIEVLKNINYKDFVFKTTDPLEV